MELENEDNVKPENEDKIAEIIKGFDGDFGLGGVGFTVNRMAGAYFDGFQVSHLDCVRPAEEVETPIFLPPHCNRFTESFSEEFDSMYYIFLKLKK